MVRRIGTKTPKVLTKRRMIRKNPRTRMCTWLLQKMSNSAVLQYLMKTYLPAHAKWFKRRSTALDKQVLLTSKPSMLSKRTISFMSFNFPEDVYDSAWAQATGEEGSGSSGDTSDWLQKGYTLENYLNSGSSVYTIDTGKSRGTTFKIDTGGYVFSWLIWFRCWNQLHEYGDHSHTWSDVTDNTQFCFSKILQMEIISELLVMSEYILKLVKSVLLHTVL